MRYAATVIAALTLTSTASAGRFLPHKHGMTLQEKISYFTRSLHHERQALAWLRSRQAPRTLQRRSELAWERAAIRWHTALLAQTLAKLVPALPPLRVYAGPCLAQIIDNEGSGWNPQRWNTSGSGAYGLPQALPGSKMASAGSDWATNPYTQIRWLRGYARARYGSDCAALAFWNRNRWY